MPIWHILNGRSNILIRGWVKKLPDSIQFNVLKHSDRVSRLYATRERADHRLLTSRYVRGVG